ncbi:hypothetical protein H5410_022732 [Solanum commersonii]|uniref:DNA helicase Pif1-like 2B domain-containing protein n=1 Tax=Solanum commersonii TaxID=4109 RepID=A0A9J5ZEV8_SOLCO|nr:hypothetical protein H5410_022732 [Solanum commersonii]
MATEVELSKHSVSINKIPKYSVNWVMRVFVIQKGSVMSYKNSHHEWTFQKVILVDDEGSKLQETLFNKHINTWKDFLKTNKSYYIANGLLDWIELSITDNTIIKESDDVFSTHNFSKGFVSLEHAEKLPNGAIFDLLCMLVTVNPIIVKGDNKRCEIVVTNKLMERITVTLWGEFAVHDDAFVEKLKDDQPVPGLCDVRVSKYRGTFGISTILVSSVLINPMFPKALDLHTWREVIKGGNEKYYNHTKLDLKENAPIMMLRNLDPANGLCNGTRLICRGFGNNIIHAKITTGEYATKQVFIPRIQLSPPENERYPFKFIRKQFPIHLCFAMTINNAQDQTIPTVGLYFPQHVFSHGQLYIALSRGISMTTTKILVMTEQPDTTTGTFTKILYTEKY